jgi:hypothetical protein
MFTMALRFRGTRLNNDQFNDTVPSKYPILQNDNRGTPTFFLDEYIQQQNGRFHCDILKIIDLG